MPPDMERDPEPQDEIAYDARLAAEILARVTSEDVAVVRLSFADQHGILRGKTIMAAELATAMRNGVRVPSSLLLKDTAHRTVFAAYEAGGGVGLAEMQGAADILMRPDLTTFRILPWAPHTGWLLCDIGFTNGNPIPFATRGLFAASLNKLASRGAGFTAGAELEFHLFRLTGGAMRPEQSGQPGTPPDIALTSAGFQYLTELRYDELDENFEILRKGLQKLGLPLRSLEVEFGPSQCEVTFGPQSGMAAADLVILARSAIKQVARRHGLHATFMCRPRIENVVSSGWHLHQSLLSLEDGSNLLQPADPAQPLSPFGRHYLAGLLHHACAASSFAAPTINGYRRYRPYSNAPDRILWGCENRGVMIRVLGGYQDAATRLENRIGEPAANPYLYMASQIVCGLDGVDRLLDPGPAADTPYQQAAPALPATLDAALEALERDGLFRTEFGNAFIDYWIKLKQAELARFHAEVTEWEHREYFSIF